MFKGVNITHHPSNILPQTPILGQEVLKIHANINNVISALNASESPKFSLLLWNLDGGTWWWHQIL